MAAAINGDFKHLILRIMATPLTTSKRCRMSSLAAQTQRVYHRFNLAGASASIRSESGPQDIGQPDNSGQCPDRTRRGGVGCLRSCPVGFRAGCGGRQIPAVPFVRGYSRGNAQALEAIEEVFQVIPGKPGEVRSGSRVSGFPQQIVQKGFSLDINDPRLDHIQVEFLDQFFGDRIVLCHPLRLGDLHLQPGLRSPV